MGRSWQADKRYLEQHRGRWRVVVGVPRPLQGKLGTKLKRSLGTDSLAVANAMKWAVLDELRAAIVAAGQDDDAKRALVNAAEVARLRRAAVDDHALGMLDLGIEMEAERLRGRAVGEREDPVTGEPEEVFDEARSTLAGQYVQVALGLATPLAHHRAAYLASLSVKSRTRADDKRAIAFLAQWCRAKHVPETLEAITPRVAGQFMDGLDEIAPTARTATTRNKYLRRLSRYWQWLQKRDVVEANVWQGKVLEEAPAVWGETERAFTDDEVVRLLSGDASQHMHDLMRIGALTGARLDAIVCLRVVDCAGGRFTFKPQKKEVGPRDCPIHPDLEEIVQRRSAGKEGEAPLFPEWPAPRRAGSKRERSFKASNHFTDYRRAVGVDAVIPGKRRSLVNFHSFRRWFVTKAEQAGQPEHIIAAVVGHKRPGMTLGRYSAGPLFDQLRACVEAVKLPTG